MRTSRLQALAAEFTTADFARASGAHPPTDWNGQSLDHKRLATAPNLAQRGGIDLQPVSQLMQSAIEARDINPSDR